MTAGLTLLRQHHPLSNPREQVRLLEAASLQPRFDDAVKAQAGTTLAATDIEVLQINVGKICNQTCRHCHVDAGPDRKETMSHDVARLCIELLRQADIPTLDITGGAPEMSLEFRWLVTEARKLNRRVIDRSNLTILVAPGFEDLPAFLAEQSVEVVASLPCYLEENVDRQRGNNVFQKSIQALRRLNGLGYGRSYSPLNLTLVFNPVVMNVPRD